MKLGQQITKLSGGSWSAARVVGADGAEIFVGTFGEALVISLPGSFFVGASQPLAISRSDLVVSFSQSTRHFAKL